MCLVDTIDGKKNKVNQKKNTHKLICENLDV